MPRFGLSDVDECTLVSDPEVFYSGADSIQCVRHLNAVREAQRLQKLELNDREKRRRSAEAVAHAFDSKLASHKACFSPKVRNENILEKSLNTIYIEPKAGPVNPPSKPAPPVIQKQSLISSTPLPKSNPNFTFSNPSTSTLSPIPNVDNIPRFRESLASPLFKTVPDPVKQATSTPIHKTAFNRNPLGTETKHKLGAVVEEETFEQQFARAGTVKYTEERYTPDSLQSQDSSREEKKGSEEKGEEEEKDTENKENTITNTTAPEWSISNEFYSDAMIELKIFLDDARMFEAKSAVATRSLIKRSILEKVTITSKRHATEEEISSTSSFFSSLLSLEEVEGFNGERLRLKEKTSVHYAMGLMIEHYLSLLERDAHLSSTVAAILYSVSVKNRPFSVFLTASLLSRAVSLDMEKEKCSALLSSIISNPSSLLDTMGRERAAAGLFYGLHAAGGKQPVKDCPFPLSSIWRVLASVLNRPSILIVTPFTLNELIKTCGSALQHRYGRQMEKIIGVMVERLLPELEKELETNPEARKAGNAAFISTLRSTLDLLAIS